MKNNFLTIIILFLALPGIAQDKVPMTALEGIWITSNLKAIEFKIKRKGLKMFLANDGGGSSIIFNEKADGTYQAVDIKNGMLTTIPFPYKLIGTTITMDSKNDMTITFSPNDSTVKAQKMRVNPNGDILVGNDKIGKVVKTSAANIMAETMAEFEIYDANDVPRFKFEGVKGKFIFLDDNKSFIPRVVDPYPEQIAIFFAKDSILSPEGFVDSYRSQFIERHFGYNASIEQTRDSTARVYVQDNLIYQGKSIIGNTTRSSKDEAGNYKVLISDINKMPIAIIQIKAEKYNMMKVSIIDPNDDLIKEFETFMNDINISDKGVTWLVDNGYL